MVIRYSILCFRSGHTQNSVIHAPPVTTSHDPNTGVLLNVHGLDNLTQTIVNDYIMNNNVMQQFISLLVTTAVAHYVNVSGK